MGRLDGDHILAVGTAAERHRNAASIRINDKERVTAFFEEPHLLDGVIVKALAQEAALIKDDRCISCAKQAQSAAEDKEFGAFDIYFHDVDMRDVVLE